MTNKNFFNADRIEISMRQQQSVINIKLCAVGLGIDAKVSKSIAERKSSACQLKHSQDPEQVLPEQVDTQPLACKRVPLNS